MADGQAHESGWQHLFAQTQLQPFLDQACQCCVLAYSRGFCLGEQGIMQIESRFDGSILLIQISV